ncbi:Fe-S cluster assembly sulfur transfer protein SufU [Fluviispira multicolorata]|uniref:SUF system NifU family Fe-S cluster assembly protein n=1 Tax=Fluviispira multicolorata TaxID=2654512 RepID=A0A833N2A1_9BACT|nr:SUF system NifU family Fe-S cluster assembly protein [Fluviispira multicolorata]KAB8032092.1 SUF system NifU family Fe-S cluster assembly protein [Fluviispira multicolorata]
MTESLKSSQSVELNALYQEVIVDHSRNPRFKSKNMPCRFCQEGKNPLCGDNITVYCQVEMKEKQPILFVGFDGTGCSISQASASIMCNSLQSVTLNEARNLIHEAEKIYTGKTPVNSDDLEHDIEALHGVSKFPVRVKCAALPWKTLHLLLSDNFDEAGLPKQGCDKLINCAQSALNQRKLKIVSTEN